MTPRHQGDPGLGTGLDAVGGSHGSDYAMDTENLPYRVKVVISVSKTR